MLRTRAAVAIAGLLFVLTLGGILHAGGDQWQARVRSVTRHGLVGGTFDLVSATAEPLLPGCDSVVVDIDYRWSRWLFKSGSQVTYSGHRAALVYLGDAAKAKQPITFDVIGGSLIPDQTRPCHLVSAGLALQKHDVGQLVVSFHDAD